MLTGKLMVFSSEFMEILTGIMLIIGFLVGGGLSPYVQLSSAGQSIMFIQMGKGLVQKNQGTWFFLLVVLMQQA